MEPSHVRESDMSNDQAARPVGRRTVHLNGVDVAYRIVEPTGSDVHRTPALLIHGIGSSVETWADVPERLAASGFRVIAVDLPGHGESSRYPGDYSLGALASCLRDLLDHLGISRVHLVGHSLGGGVALQFQYQFPDRAAAMVLESSGGLGEETFTGLRAASLPGSEIVIGWAINQRTLGAATWVGDQLSRVGIRPHALSPRALETVSWLGEPDRRTAFLATLRSVVGPGGQRVSALNKLHLLEGSNVLIIWGDRDPMIPIHHGQAAHDMLQGSRFVVFRGAGHEPHLDDSERFAELVVDHLSSH